MRDKMTLFSTRSGALLHRFGIKIRTSGGHCGEMEAKVLYSQNGQYSIASKQGADEYEDWIYPANGGSLQWHKYVPYTILETALGHFLVDTPRKSWMAFRIKF